MNRFKRFPALVVFATALFLGACSQDETMDEIIDNTEINKPINADDTQTGTETGTDHDLPGGN